MQFVMKVLWVLWGSVVLTSRTDWLDYVLSSLASLGRQARLGGKMTQWTLEKAKNGFSEVVRRALAHEPQVVTRGARAEDAVVVIARSDYERMIAPRPLTEYLANSPLAKAVSEGIFGYGERGDLFARDRDPGRDIDLG
jgi:prevent-host-death family protein